MSKFVEMLHKVGQHLPTPIGFGPASRQDAPAPHIMLIGRTTPDELASNSGALDAEVDAVLVDVGSEVDSLTDGVSDSLKDKLWGVMADSISVDQASVLKEKGCDFVVFQSDGTDAAVLNDDDLGKVLSVTAELDEDFARAVHGLSIDAALYMPEIDLTSLTIRKLIEIEKVRGLYGKPFVIGSQTNLGEPALESLRNGDINGLVVQLSEVEGIAATKKAIASLPRPKPRSASGDTVAQAPSVGFMPRPRQEEEEPDEEEDDF